MCDYDTISYVCRTTGKNLRFRTLKSGRTAYTIDWRNTIAYDFIRRIAPFLRGKREQAKLCMLFNETLAPGRGHTYTAAHAKKCEFIRNKLKELKRPDALRC